MELDDRSEVAMDRDPPVPHRPKRDLPVADGGRLCAMLRAVALSALLLAVCVPSFGILLGIGGWFLGGLLIERGEGEIVHLGALSGLVVGAGVGVLLAAVLPVVVAYRWWVPGPGAAQRTVQSVVAVLLGGGLALAAYLVVVNLT